LTFDYEPAKRNRKKKRHFGDDEDSYLVTLNKAKEKAGLAEETSDLTSDYESAKRNRKTKRHFEDDEDSSNSSSEDEISSNLKLPEPPKKRGNLQFLKTNCG
jgi:hypothetical protein